jgi:NADH:ubiquinone oxidoreductase subunit F (NADH-binding)/(2Fe-2S) ferredoxin
MNYKALDELRNKLRMEREQKPKKVWICMGGGCVASGATRVLQKLQDEIQKANLTDVEVKPVGCLGACNQGPLVRMLPEEMIYQKVTEAEVGSIVLDHLQQNHPLHHLLLFSDQSDRVVEKASEHEFYKRQHKIVLENCGYVDPESLEDYIAYGGYQSLQKALMEMSREEVVAEVKQSGLRGRGGAGFPTGTKWEMSYKFMGENKYLICNGDEGDPGAFMDRSVLESDPHRVLEGMILGGYAVGANRGYAYIRGEYPLAIQRFTTAIQRAKKMGLLGKNILETDFSFDVEVRIGAGAFVCGEETALIASIEGKRGTPHPRPPYPAQKGLWDMPTLINNVETFANIPPIIHRGGEWYASIGRPKSAGTKVFALSGRVVNTGLVEVPIGTTLRDIIFEIGGGIPQGKRFKAAQTGGPSGGCIPEIYLDTPLDYESLIKLGSIMGSGGLIVMDETSCMPDVARYFMEFCMDESCGKCIPCRVGTKQMHLLLNKICHFQASEEDLQLLESLAWMVKETSLCGLGMSAPNPLLSTLRYFREEYLIHINERRCPAGVCQGILSESGVQS